MAKRPVFYLNDHVPFFSEEIVNFEFNPGFADVQKQKNIRNIHFAFSMRHPNSKILEISSKSEDPLGVKLSAFNLKVRLGDQMLPLESVFQAGKVFRDGGPYTDLLVKPPYIAKKDHRLRESGPIQSFVFAGKEFPTEPKTFFYDWLYVKAVSETPELSAELTEYDAFTDVEFNPEKSLNCQARSAAVYVSLVKAGLLNRALDNCDEFRRIVYFGNSAEEEVLEETGEQLCLFE